MGEFNLNLSTRPFPAYRVVNLALLVVLIAVAAISFWQFQSFTYYSAQVKDIRAAQQEAQVQKTSLSNELSELGTRLDRPVTTAKLNEIDYLNGLIARKHFSWTEVFSNLESVIPDSVHLNGVTPEILKDKVMLHMEISTKSISDESEFIRRMQASPVFQDVVVTREEQKGNAAAGELDVMLNVAYFPERRPGDNVPIVKAVAESPAGSKKVSK